mmetsp:Transcript_4925/g.7188  ORF Transcript_4925/g.7188 Transcript_4925/m.7188 type:complete len:368 (-) Transcript_4925:102-1205(-)|eukprot:CAMPEP_0116030686 /NCGR_PEP_ID=MMETSP0321-20121206/17011_1 /TAXON_ID=163516 /ORGANISM="Leptocylindrus danicus var. danicus, Strain B650" /LENGTH=367 /DNA_ID=CAMNT_0003505557 /DNA_START=170 /DNA_END=1273 /DNA_ORIENTATION=+
MATILDGKGTLALAALDANANLTKHEFGRPEPEANDVSIDIKYCGMCHSDLHACNGDWGINLYPIAPGHEIGGIVQSVGSNVTNYKVGDRVAVGCFVSSCRTCELCESSDENLCNGHLQTYSSVWPEGRGHKECVGCHTNGGYTSQITVDQHFVYSVPDKISLEHVGPLLCAGITMFTPLNKHVLKKKQEGKTIKVGIAGFGGLGHMGVKLAKAMGADVVVFSRTTSKAEEAAKLGATLVAHGDPDALKAAAYSCDVIVDTIAVSHPIDGIMSCLKKKGTYVFIGGIPQPVSVSPFALLFHNWSMEGSLVGGVQETKDMLAFCAEHDIVPDIQVIAAKDANAQFQAMAAGTSSAERCVIDMSTLADL